MPIATAGAPVAPSGARLVLVAWQKIWRLAGVDHMHVNGLGNKFSETDDSVIASARRLPDADVRGQAVHRDAGVLLGPDGGAGCPTLRALGSTDLIFAAGGGILAHPEGPAAGVADLARSMGRARSAERVRTPREP